MYTMKTTFSLGPVYLTHLTNQEGEERPAFRSFILQALRRHAAGDWGDCGPEDRAANELALTTGDRILGVYQLPANIRSAFREDRIWIITEADRSATTVLWPSEY
jgi:hypothetical protein